MRKIELTVLNKDFFIKKEIDRANIILDKDGLSKIECFCENEIIQGKLKHLNFDNKLIQIIIEKTNTIQEPAQIKV